MLNNCWCLSRTCKHYYHLQGKVQFQEDLTYLPLNYVHQPQPDPFPYIHRLRNTNLPVRRQIIHDYEYDSCSTHSVDEEGREIHEGWHDQEYRDLNKYCDTDGILLKPLHPDESLDKFFENLSYLSLRDEKSGQKVRKIIFNLLLACGESTEYIRQAHLRKEYQVTVQDLTVRTHEYWPVRTNLTNVPKTIISDRYPYYYRRNYHYVLPESEINITPTLSVIDHSTPGEPRSYRVVVLGLLPGIHNQLISG